MFFYFSLFISIVCDTSGMLLQVLVLSIFQEENYLKINVNDK